VHVEVVVRLHTERADGPGIRAGLEQTPASIKQAVEGSSTDQRRRRILRYAARVGSLYTADGRAR
jgi:hypothetical protein